MKITDPLGRVTQRFVDGAGRVLTQTDPLGQATRIEYNKTDQPTAVIDALGGTTTYGYDPPGRLTMVTDARNKTTLHTFDESNRLVARTDPLSKTATYAHDLDGNVVETNDRKGQRTTRRFDGLNRLSQIDYADGSTISYEYDAANRLIAIDDSTSGTISRTYDGLGRLLSETTPSGTVGYTYDAAGRRATMTVPGQATTEYRVCDAANRLTTVTQGTDVVTMTYDVVNRRSSVALPNGMLVEYAYDEASQLTGLTFKQGAATVGTLTYTYDLAGNRTEIGGTWARAGLPQPVASAASDAANRLSDWAGLIFNYDANGQVVSDGQSTYSWNARNLLSSVSGPMAASYAYDGTGRRAQKTLSGQTTTFLFDHQNVVRSRSAARHPRTCSTARRSTKCGAGRTRLDQLAAERRAGSTVAETDGSGVVQAHYQYEPFGKTQIVGGAGHSRGRYHRTGTRRSVNRHLSLSRPVLRRDDRSVHTARIRWGSAAG